MGKSSKLGKGIRTWILQCEETFSPSVEIKPQEKNTKKPTTKTVVEDTPDDYPLLKSKKTKH